MTRPSWFPDWRGKTCAIVASGPSAKTAPLDLLRGRVPVVVINTSFQLAPWADVLYACDAKWWDLYNGVPEFKGLKVSQDAVACERYPDIIKVSIDPRSNGILLAKPGHLGGGANSGHQTVNLVVQFGVRRILLVGFDMVNGDHWHPRHPPPLNNPDSERNIPRWRAALDGAVITLYQHGVMVVNCSPISALKSYPKMSLEDALDGIPR